MWGKRRTCQGTWGVNALLRSPAIPILSSQRRLNAINVKPERSVLSAIYVYAVLSYILHDVWWVFFPTSETPQIAKLMLSACFGKSYLALILISMCSEHCSVICRRRTWNLERTSSSPSNSKLIRWKHLMDVIKAYKNRNKLGSNNQALADDKDCDKE